MKTTSKIYLEKIAREKGVPMASPKHPIYSSAPSIMFSHRTRKASQAKGSGYHPKG